MSLGKVVVVGQGYVGFPLAMAAVRANWTVVGVDLSERVIESISSGKSHIEDISSEELQSALKSGRYSATTKFEDVRDCDICVVCVPTPVDEEKNPDLSFLESAIRNVADLLPSHSLLISESTSFPGTVNELIIPILNEMREDRGVDIDVVSAPERIDPRNEKFDLKSTPRIIGGKTPKASNRAKDFYSTFCDSVTEVSSPVVAEFAKLLENTYRQVNIALVNQLVPFARSMGVDIREVVAASASKPYGFMPFYPGAGVGGHCIPVDPLYLLWRARKVEIDLPFIHQADIVNSGMPAYVVGRLLNLLEGPTGGHIAILGVAYKPGLGDIRETPAKEVANELLNCGYSPVWRDHFVDDFHGFEEYSGHDIRAAIVVTAQPGLLIDEFISLKVPILDCTGVFKGIDGVEQL